MLECPDCYMSDRHPLLLRCPQRGAVVRLSVRRCLGWVWAGCLLTGLLATPAIRAQMAAEPGALATPGAVAAASGPLADPLALTEAQLKQALDDLRRQQREMVDLRMRAAAAESAAGWLPWLLLMLMGLGAAAVWLGLRVRRLQKDAVRRHWAAAEAELHAAVVNEGSATSAPLLLGETALLSTKTAGTPNGAARELKVARNTTPASALGGLTDGARTTTTLTQTPDAPARAVTVEELLDLEQQVDFFMVLGQEQAAIDLLQAHVRATGGINALPFFKLLEIYRQQGDEEAYDRTRERFNRRFNAKAPQFDADFAAGRQLADYPAVVARLERAWPETARALAELDSLLLRRADLEPFDLPAFHDLLTLHALVRDLPPTAAVSAGAAVAAPPATTASSLAAALAERTVAVMADRPAPARPSPVDFLLPLESDSSDPTEPRPRLTEPTAARTLLADWMQNRSTLRGAELSTDAGWHAEPVLRPERLDLDLTEHAPSPREFTRPAAFMDMATRRDTRPSDLSAFDDSDLLPPSITRR